VNHAGTGARVGGAGVQGAGVEGTRAPKPLSNAAAPDDVKGLPSSGALAKSSGTKGMQSYCEELCFLHSVQHVELTICTCWQQLCAGSSCTLMSRRIRSFLHAVLVVPRWRPAASHAHAYVHSFIHSRMHLRIHSLIHSLA